MLMTPLKLIAIRLYLITLGRFVFFSKLLRQVLVAVLIQKQSKTPYVASSRFFDVDELAPR